MKYRLILVVISIMFYKTIHCQDNNLYPSLELFMQTINPNNDEITIRLESLSPTWDYDKYEGLFFLSTEPSIISSAVSIVGTDTSNNHGWDLVTSKTFGGEVCGIGLYKMKANTGTAFVIFDFRECMFALVNHDTWFRYNKPEDKFYWNDKLRINQWNGTTSGNLIRIWDIKQTMTGTSCITDYWQNCLVVIPSEDGNSPRLVWGPIPNFQADGYKIYWSLNTQGGPPEGFGLLAEVGPNTYEYTHEDIAINGNWKAYYKVKAYNSTSESGFTNTVEIGVRGFFKDKGNSYTDVYNEFTLHSNYPNPFSAKGGSASGGNPITKIKFTVASQSPVEIKVYDPFGREIKTLVNEIKNVGTHEIKFDGSNPEGSGQVLPSGIYFLRMKAGSFMEVKKMLLVK